MYKTSWTSVDKIAVLFVQEDLFNFQYKYTIYNTSRDTYMITVMYVQKVLSNCQ